MHSFFKRSSAGRAPLMTPLSSPELREHASHAWEATPGRWTPGHSSLQARLHDKQTCMAIKCLPNWHDAHTPSAAMCARHACMGCAHSGRWCMCSVLCTRARACVQFDVLQKKQKKICFCHTVRRSMEDHDPPLTLDDVRRLRFNGL